MAHLLFCEDEPSIQRLIQASLRSTGHEVAVAGNGEEGLRLARDRRPALIVTDLSMPGMGGLELLDAVLADNELKGIPVLVMTASVERGKTQELHQRGATAVIQKPFSPAALRTTIDSLLEAGAKTQGR